MPVEKTEISVDEKINIRTVNLMAKIKLKVAGVNTL